jgi:hypothetical protein
MSPPRQAVLLVLPVVFPSLIIAALGVMVIRQEQELSERRSSDRRRQIASEVRRGSPRCAPSSSRAFPMS